MKKTYLTNLDIEVIEEFKKRLSQIDIVDGIRILPICSKEQKQLEVAVIYFEQIHDFEGYFGPKSRAYNQKNIDLINRQVIEFNEKYNNGKFVFKSLPREVLSSTANMKAITDLANSIIIYDQFGVLDTYKKLSAEKFESYDNLMEVAIKDKNEKKDISLSSFYEKNKNIIINKIKR